MTQHCELVLCAGCLRGQADAREPADLVIKNLQQVLPETVRLRVVECMNVCDAPVTFALQGPGRATYLFKGIDPQEDQQDLLSTCAAYQSSGDGWIEDAHACGRLRHCLVGRVPTLTESAKE